MKTEHEFTIAHLFAGIGGGALGTAAAQARLGEHVARFRTVGGIDVDALACADFERLVGAPALAADVHTLTPARLRRAWGRRAPDVVLSSPPCKSFSGLLSAAKAVEPRYEAMSRLLLDGLFLLCSTWKEPPALLFFENVPRITVRGKHLLEQARALLVQSGYAVTGDEYHDAGEVGGLAQHRRRFFLVARCRRRVPQFVYVPPKKRVRACGEVLGPLPTPGDTAAGGPLHSLPRISWRNWIRLALIPAGGDWRDLPGALPAGTKRRERFKRHRVERFDQPVGTVGGSGSNSPGAVADPRLGDVLGVRPDSAEDREAWERRGERGGAGTKWFKGKYGVGAWDDPARTVVGGPSNGASAVADPRVPAFGNVDRVTPWDQPVGTVTHSPAPSSGGGAVADPRFTNIDHVTPWEDPARTVTGASRPGGGAPSVADPRLPDLAVHAGNQDAHRNKFTVSGWEEPARTVIGAGRPGSGAPSVADPRLPDVALGRTAAGAAAFHGSPGLFGVNSWDEPAPTITGSTQVSGSNAPAAVADPRVPGIEVDRGFSNAYTVADFGEPAPTITGATDIQAGAPSVADRRVPGDYHAGAYGVASWDEPLGTVTGDARPPNGRFSVADPRLGCEPRAGAYRVLGWEEAAQTITGSLQVDNGAAAVADPRCTTTPPDGAKPDRDLDPDKPPPFTPVIVAEDGTWHRPLTTLELAVLQGFPVVVNGEPLVVGQGQHTRAREFIGNAIPPPAAKAVGEQLLGALLASKLHEFQLSASPVWVAPPPDEEERPAAAEETHA